MAEISTSNPHVEHLIMGRNPASMVAMGGGGGGLRGERPAAYAVNGDADAVAIVGSIDVPTATVGDSATGQGDGDDVELLCDCCQGPMNVHWTAAAWAHLFLCSRDLVRSGNAGQGPGGG